MFNCPAIAVLVAALVGSTADAGAPDDVAPADPCSKFAELVKGDEPALIVSLADPLETPLGMKFDEGLDAVQRAMESEHYTLVGFWLPWAERKATPDEEGDGRPLAADDCRRSTPGILDYRSELGVPKRVLVVGESPLTGVNGGMLERALKARDGPILLLGPMFSGSAPGLAERLAGRGRKVTVVTGTATSPENKAIFSGAGFTFGATVHDYRTLLRTFFGRLGELGVDPDNVVLLVESNTRYGQDVIEEAKAGSLANGEQGSRRVAPALVITFPAHISRIRDAYERQAVGGSATLAGRRLPRGSLPLGAEEQAALTDVLSPVSSRSVNIEEQVLHNLLVALGRRHVDFLGVIASDPADKVYLANEVREFLPDVHLFSLESEIVYTHPALKLAMYGSFMLGTYPSLLDYQGWTPMTEEGGRERVQFASSASEGIYNAALLLLHPGLLAGESAEADPPALRDYGPPFLPDVFRFARWGRTAPAVFPQAAPPVYLSMVGKTSIWPVYIAPAPAKDSYITHLPRPPEPTWAPLAISRAAVFVVAAFIGLCLWLCFSFWFGWDPRKRWRRLVPDIMRTAATGQRTAAWRSILFGWLLFWAAGAGILGHTPTMYARLTAWRDASGAEIATILGMTLPAVLLAWGVCLALLRPVGLAKAWGLARSSAAKMRGVPRVLLLALAGVLFFSLTLAGMALVSLSFRINALACQQSGWGERFRCHLEDVIGAQWFIPLAMTWLLISGVMSLRRWWDPEREIGSWGLRTVLFSTAALLPAMTGVCAIGSFIGLELIGVNNLIRFERSANPADGTGPATPIVYLVFTVLLFLLIELLRARLSDRIADSKVTLFRGLAKRIPDLGSLEESAWPYEGGWASGFRGRERRPEAAPSGRAALARRLRKWARILLVSTGLGIVLWYLNISPVGLPVFVVLALIAAAVFRSHRFAIEEAAFPLAISIVSLFVLSRAYIHSLDGFVFDWLFLALFAVSTGLVAMMIHREWMVWRYTRRILLLFARFIPGNALARVPAKMGATFASSFLLAIPRPLDLRPLWKELDKLRVAIPGSPDRLSELIRASHTEEQDRLVWGSDLCWSDAGEKEIEEALSSGPAELRAAAENVIAMRAFFCISWLLAQLRVMAIFVLLGPILMILGVGKYPFQSQRLFTLFIAVMMIAGVSITATILVQFRRDYVISRFMGSTSGHITWSVGSVVQLLSVIGLPLLAYLSIQQPEIGEWVAHWLGPLLGAGK